MTKAKVNEDSLAPQDGPAVIDVTGEKPRGPRMLVRGVECFRAGDHGANGKWSREFVQELASTYIPEFLEAPVTPDHVQEGEAWGWVKQAYESDGKLLCDLELYPYSYYLLREGYYKRRSVEFYESYNLPTGKKGPYLKAVSLLGANTPAVKGMRNVFSVIGEGARNVATVFDAGATAAWVSGPELASPIAASNLQQNAEEPETRKEKKQMEMTEDKVNELIQNATRELCEKLSSKDGELATATEQIKALSDKLAEQETRAAAQAQVAKFREDELTIAKLTGELRTEGRITPALSRKAAAIFHGIRDSQGVVKFAASDKEEAKDTDLAELFASFLKDLPKAVSGAVVTSLSADDIAPSVPANFNDPVYRNSVIAARAKVILAEHPERDPDEVFSEVARTIAAEQGQQ